MIDSFENGYSNFGEQVRECVKNSSTHFKKALTVEMRVCIALYCFPGKVDAKQCGGIYLLPAINS